VNGNSLDIVELWGSGRNETHDVRFTYTGVALYSDPNRIHILCGYGVDNVLNAPRKTHIP
jgi:hypothetical protein